MKHSLIAFLFLPLAIFGQTTETSQKPDLWLGLSFSPDWSSKFTSISNEAIEPVLGFTGGISVFNDLDEQILLEVGVQYSSKGFAEKSLYYIPTLSPAEPVSGYGRIEHRFSYFDIPVKLNFRPFSNRLFFISGGVEFHLLLNKNTTLVTDFSTALKMEDFNEYKPVSASVVAGFGTDFKIGNICQVRIEPLFRRMIRPIHTNNSNIRYYLWSAGFNIGFFRHFQ